MNPQILSSPDLTAIDTGFVLIDDGEGRVG